MHFKDNGNFKFMRNKIYGNCELLGRSYNIKEAAIMHTLPLCAQESPAKPKLKMSAANFERAL